MSESRGPVYEVSFTPKDLEQLRVWGEAAERRGIKGVYAEALKTIREKLATEPLSWGDPLYRLHHLRLLVCHRFYWIFSISYGVDEERHLVHVKECKLNPGDVLDDK
jgi:hypothetical protein